MIYTSGVVTDSDKFESLEQLQDNKMSLVCHKLDLQPSDKCVDRVFAPLPVFLFFSLNDRLLQSFGHWLWLGYFDRFRRQELWLRRHRCHHCQGAGRVR
jgi:hypothetical protein